MAGRYTQRLNGVDGFALTKLDVMDELEEVKVCTAYRIGGEERRDFPADRAEQEAAEPVYKTVPGWQADTVGTLHFDDLPQAAKDYVEMIEEELEAPVLIVSTGPRREETILRRDLEAFQRVTGGRL